MVVNHPNNLGLDFDKGSDSGRDLKPLLVVCRRVSPPFVVCKLIWVSFLSDGPMTTLFKVAAGQMTGVFKWPFIGKGAAWG